MDLLGGLNFNNIPSWVWVVLVIFIVVWFIKRKKKGDK
jgi:predicted ABC-type sugar transport system permease subunit